MDPLTALILGGSALFGGIASSEASKRAAEEQRKAAEEQMKLAREQFNAEQEELNRQKQKEINTQEANSSALDEVFSKKKKKLDEMYFGDL